MLSSLRDFATTIFVVSNSALTAESRDKLEAVADTVFARENVGFDVWGYKEALEAFGADKLAEYDELILMNYTVFGPVYPFAEMFSRLEASDVDFWGVTAHKAIDPNPFEVPGAPAVLPAHIQSHWIAVRNKMFTSLEFRDYWRTMPMIESYSDSIMKHESRFTKHFADRGFSYEVAFPAEDYPDEHPIFQNFDLLLRDRCPIVKRRIFFHEPTYLDRNAILGKRLMQLVEETDYPTRLIWQNVVRSVEPRTLYTNLSLLEIVSEHDDGYRPEPAKKVAVLAHLYYDDMVDEVMSYLTNIPVGYDLFVTTSSDERKQKIEEALAGYAIDRVEVRVTEQNRGRDMSSLFISFRDVLRSGQYDIMCRVHSKRSPQNDYNNGQLFKHHMFDNLLYSPGYVANILRLFDENPTLGMVFPPVVNIGFPTLGHSWFTNRESAHSWASVLGIKTVFDRSTPIAPYGTMYWFRPDALQDFAAFPFAWEDYPAEPGHSDGGLAHVQERLLAYAAMNAGFHVRSVINRDWAAINYAFLEYKLQRVASMLPAYPQEQIDYLVRVQSTGNLLGLLKARMDAEHPRLSMVLRPGYKAARSAYRLGKKGIGSAR